MNTTKTPKNEFPGSKGWMKELYDIDPVKAEELNLLRSIPAGVWTLIWLPIALICVVALAGCANDDADQGDNPQPAAVAAEDHLPDDVYSVKQRAQAHFEAVMDERLTLLNIVQVNADALNAYMNGVDARGARFAADGLVQTQIEDCRAKTDYFADTTLPEAQELLVALDRGQVGLERFKLRFYDRFDPRWANMNDCWAALWEDPTFDPWRARFHAQADSIAEEARMAAEERRRAEEARRAAAAREFREAEAERRAADARERAFRRCQAQRDAGFRAKRVIQDGVVNVRLFDGEHAVGTWARPSNAGHTWKLARFDRDVADWVDRVFWTAFTFDGGGRKYGAAVEALGVQWRTAGSPGCER